MKSSARFFFAVLLPVLFVMLSSSGCSTPDTALPADLAALQSTVKSHVKLFARCYEQGRKSDPDLGGPISLTMTVRENGSTADVRLVSNDLGDTVGSCFVVVFQKMPFPRITRDTRYEESFCFEPDPAGTRCQKTR